jgi:hypothetical protein
MIVVSSGRVIGTGDFNSVLVLDPSTQEFTTYPMEGAWVARVAAELGGSVAFELFDVDRDSEPWFRLVVCDARRPEQRIASLAVSETDTVDWHGPADLWGRLPRLFVRGRGQRNGWEEVAVRLEDRPGAVGVTKGLLTGLREQTDVGILGHISPDGRWALLGPIGAMVVAVGDSSVTRLLRTIELPSPLCDVAPRAGPSGSQVWLACYNHLVLLDLESGDVRSLDVASWRDDHVVDFAFDQSRRTCAVALYRSGAILTIDAANLVVTHLAETAQSLGGVAVLEDGRFVAKPWEGDEYLIGPLRQVPFALPDTDKG